MATITITFKKGNGHFLPSGTKVKIISNGTFSDKSKRINENGTIKIQIGAQYLESTDWNGVTFEITTPNNKKFNATDVSPPVQVANASNYTMVVKVAPAASGSEITPPAITPLSNNDNTTPTPNPPTPLNETGAGNVSDRSIEPINWKISGKVKSDDNRPLPGLRLKAFAKGIGKTQALGQTTTNENGHYAITYKQEQLLPNKQGNASALVRVFYKPENQNSETRIYQSPLLRKLTPRYKHQIEILRSDYRDFSAFKQIKQKINELDLDVAFTELGRDDIELIAEEADLEKSSIRQFIKAHKLSETILGNATQVNLPQVIYGLIRAGIKGKANTIAELRDNVVLRHLETAVEQNWIEPLEYENAVVNFLPKRVNYLFKEKRSYTNALKAVGLNQPQIKKFFSSFLSSNKPTDALIDKLEEDTTFQQGTISKLRKGTELHDFTDGDIELIGLLSRQIKQPRDLAGLSFEDWLNVIQSRYSTFPESAEGDTDEEKAKNLATDFQNKVERTYPTAVLQHTWKSHSRDIYKKISLFLGQNEDFDFANQELETYLQETPRAFRGLTGIEELTESLKQLEDLFHVTPVKNKAAVIQALHKVKIHTADDIEDYGKGRFIRMLEKEGIPNNAAATTYAKATRDMVRGLFSALSTKPAQQLEEEDDTNRNPARAQPALTSLFGLKSSHNCSHCQSALSPSAYLEDLLHYLDQAQTRDGLETGKDVLLHRRSDIAVTARNCKNSDTPLPYIDLVNEILENVVTNWDISDSLSDNKPVKDMLLEYFPDPQHPDDPNKRSAIETGLEADELAAHPEFLVPKAYNRLKQTSYPWTLPYNLWADEVRTYLQQISIDRTDLMMALSPLDTPFESEKIAADRLRLEPLEIELIGSPQTSPDALKSLWRDTNPVNSRKGLIEFLNTTGLSFEEADKVFSTAYVNGNNILPKNIEDIDSETLTGLNVRILDRFHRFTRLWKKTGWPCLELDAVIRSLGNRPFALGDQKLQKIGILAEIHHRYGTPIEEIASWFGNLNTHNVSDAKALYQRSFRDPSIIGLVDANTNADDQIDLRKDVFRINSAGDLVVTNPQNTHDKWFARRSSATTDWELHTAYIPVITAACRISTQDLLLMLDTNLLTKTTVQVGSGEEVLLNLMHLSRIFRMASIAQTLDLPVRSLLTWKALLGSAFGTKPNQELKPLQTVTMLEKISALEHAGIDADLLNYALHPNVDVDGLTPTKESLLGIIDKLRSDLKKTRAENETIAYTAEELLTFWFSTDPTISDEDASALFTLLRKESISDEDLAIVYDKLTFLPKDSDTDAAMKGDSSERLNFIAQELPVDVSLLLKLNEWLSLDPDLDPSAIQSLTRIAAGISPLLADEQKSLLQEAIPYVPTVLFTTAQSDQNLKISGIERALYRHWVSSNTILQSLATELKTDGEALRLLLLPQKGKAASATGLSLADLTSDAFIHADAKHQKAVQQGLKVLHRRTSLISTLKLDATTIGFVLERGNDIGIYNFSAKKATPHQCYKLSKLVELDDALQSDELSLYGFIEQILDNGLDEETAITALAGLLDLSVQDLTDLLGQNGLAFSYPDDYLNILRLERLLEAATFVKRSKLSAEQVIALASGKLNLNKANIAKNAVRAHYNHENWLRVSETLREGIRERQRDALLEFIIKRPMNIKRQMTREQAYAYYLIDVEMSHCYRTSRIKQAIASVQQFIQRILLNLENKGLAFEENDAEEWKWRKNYRVWEANLKVFVYPENWLEPELRDNKTPFFEELEQELLQGELTNELAEKAVINYLEKLHEVSNLEIVSMYEDTQDDGDGGKEKILYVLGRTQNTRQFYLRKWLNKEVWTPWEKIEMEIESDHVIPVVHNNSLYVFWAIFNEKVDEDESDCSDLDAHLDVLKSKKSGFEEKLDEFKKLAKLPGYLGDSYQNYSTKIRDVIDEIDMEIEGGSYIDSTGKRHRKTGIFKLKKQRIENSKYQEIRLAWISHKNSSWSGKNISEKPLEGLFKRSPNTYRIKAKSKKNRLDVIFYTAHSTGAHRDRDTVDRVAEVKIGHFRLNYCQNRMVAFQERPRTYTPDLGDDTDSTLFRNGGIEYTKHILNTFNYQGQTSHLALADGVTLLENNSSNPDLDSFATTLHQNAKRVSPFFFTDAKRTFFVYKENDKYTFRSHYHPYACSTLRQIRRFGVKGFYRPKLAEQDTNDARNLKRQLTSESNFDFDRIYQPNDATVKGIPKEIINFSFKSSYGIYNWELFFHAPVLIACRLMKYRRFEEAQKWFHYIFDPTTTKGRGAEKYWHTKPFYKLQQAGEDGAQEDLDEFLDDNLIDSESMIEQWEEHPFQPHLIARFRTTAYMKMVVMKYLDNLIAWGDSLFRRDSMESINEATQLYIFVLNLLGDKPLILDREREPTPRRRGRNRRKPKKSDIPHILKTLKRRCLPYNDKLLDYWDILGDRLFKIRHCMNIDGVVRQLPLYQPPIDPALLVRAAASGADISTVLNDRNAPPPHYRFSSMYSKAIDLCADVRSLGGLLLSVLEKRDSEALSRLRSDHETGLLKQVKYSKQLAIKESKLSLEGLGLGQKLIELRRDFYSQRKYINVGENIDMVMRAYALYFRTVAQTTQTAVTPLHNIPQLTTGIAGIASPVTLTTWVKPSEPAKSSVNVFQIIADLMQTSGGIAQTLGSYDRRKEDWDHQAELAEQELKQYAKQIAAAEIRLALAEKDLENHEKQIELAEEANAFIKDKFTNEQLYSWMIGQLAELYQQSYGLAYETAKKAEHCYRRELGVEDSSFIEFGYWNDLKKGLLAGERLQLDLKRMESQYTANNRRELELSKTISLASINPEQLIRLTRTGECFITLPEALFDLDYPGHYFRRIKSVSITIPAITGPYTTVSFTLSLLNSRYRKKPETGDDESLFHWDTGLIQSIATSSGQSDSGLFQLDFRDERYLPFERAGVISSWQFKLTNPDFAQFDYETISDVLLQINYTARDGGEGFRKDVENDPSSSLKTYLNTQADIPQLISLKNDFPESWAKFMALDTSTPNDFTFSIQLSNDHFPYFLRQKVTGISTLIVIAVPKDNQVDGKDFELANSTLNEDVTFANDPVVKYPSATLNELTSEIDAIQLKLSGDVTTRQAQLEDLLMIFIVDLN